MMAKVLVGALALCLILDGATATLPRRKIEMSNSFIQTSLDDFNDNLCQNIINAAYSSYTRSINFVLTPNVMSASNNLVYSFCYKQGNGCVAANANTIAQYKAGVKACAVYALKKGFTRIHTLMHVDQYNVVGGWRNFLKMNPVAKYGGWSYQDILVQPACEAIDEAITETNKNNIKVEITVTGEMGYSLFGWPSQYGSIADHVRYVFFSQRNRGNVQVGFNVNHDKVCGCINPTQADPIVYNTTYLSEYNKAKAAGALKFADIAGLKTLLLTKANYISISGYGAMAYPPQLQDMARSIQTANYEFLAFGIDLRTLITANNKAIIYSEAGLGGGGQSNNDVRYLVTHPFFGEWVNYSKAVDPWIRPGFTDMRRRYFSLMLSWLQTGGVAGGYRIDGWYLWNVGTFDVQGIWPGQSNSQGSFADPTIVTQIKNYNKAVNGL